MAWCKTALTPNGVTAVLRQAFDFMDIPETWLMVLGRVYDYYHQYKDIAISFSTSGLNPSIRGTLRTCHTEECFTKIFQPLQVRLSFNQPAQVTDSNHVRLWSGTLVQWEKYNEEAGKWCYKNQSVTHGRNYQWNIAPVRKSRTFHHNVRRFFSKTGLHKNHHKCNMNNTQKPWQQK